MENLDWQKLLPLLIAILLTSSCLYLLGYWYHFNVLIFEYLSVNDVIKTSITSIPLVVGIAAIGIIYGILVQKMFQLMSKTESPGSIERADYLHGLVNSFIPITLSI
jgi:hypothetical protein